MLHFFKCQFVSVLPPVRIGQVAEILFLFHAESQLVFQVACRLLLTGQQVMLFQRVLPKVEQLFGDGAAYIINNLLVMFVDECPLQVGISEEQVAAVDGGKVIQYLREGLCRHTFG